MRTKIMNDEHILNLQGSMQFFRTKVPIIVLQGIEEQFPSLREIVVSAVCLAADKRFVSYSEDLYDPKKGFLGILFYFSFSVISDFKDDFLYL
jgi:hypothetical protein